MERAIVLGATLRISAAFTREIVASFANNDKTERSLGVIGVSSMRKAKLYADLIELFV